MAMIRTISHPIRVVALGGGTGLPVVLRGFKSLIFSQDTDDRDRLVAIVAVSDDGGSSGRLRDELGMIPPGDIRNCLVALSHNEPLMARLFQARYRSGGALDGHAAGNLILAALAQEEGNILAAIRLASEVLNIHGRVLPASLESTRLVARMSDGREVAGESRIAATGGDIDRIRINPARPAATPGAVRLIEKADIVVLGPGSLYTSILPNLLVPEIAAALDRTAAFRVLVLNAMTEPGETGAFSAADHVRALRAHTVPGMIDAVMIARDTLPPLSAARYRDEGACRVSPEDLEIDGMVPIVARRDLLEFTPKVRHDPMLTAGGILATYAEWLETRDVKRGDAPRAAGGRR